MLSPYFPSRVDSQQIPSQLHMRVRSAGRFKAVMRLRQAIEQRARSSRLQRLIRPPSPCCKALRLQNLKAILRRLQMLLASIHQVSLHRRAQRVHIAIRMPVRQRVLSAGKWNEHRIIQILLRQLAVTRPRSHPIHQVKILRQRVALVPAPRDISIRTPRNIVLHNMLGQHLHHCIRARVQ